MLSPTDHPHRRRNALTGEWVLVSPHRNKRPWQGQVEKLPAEMRPSYDPTCYLCPGNERAGGAKNPSYTDTFVFTNDFAALLPDTPEYHSENTNEEVNDLFIAQSVRGTSRVLCFSPRHDLSLAEMQTSDIRKVVELWSDQVRELEQTYSWVQVFESKGEIIGTSNPHPHGQIWASDFLPYQPSREDIEQRKYFEKYRRPLLLDYVEEHEIPNGERIVTMNDHWVVLVPYWAYWPFETLVLPRRHMLRIPDLTNDERHALADILRRMLTRYDNLFETSFPYRSGWHAAPSAKFFGDVQHWQLHAHYYPPLLRSATVQKFLASYEWLAEMQRDLTPEQAAERLRGLSETHYKHR
ncbi:MAG: UDP-glucose--hexose-1-phosphate uridylyltransferase [Trueperaceae bacterium]